MWYREALDILFYHFIVAVLFSVPAIIMVLCK